MTEVSNDYQSNSKNKQDNKSSWNTLLLTDWNLSHLRCWDTEVLVRNLVTMCQTILANSHTDFIFFYFTQISDDTFSW